MVDSSSTKIRRATLPDGFSHHQPMQALMEAASQPRPLIDKMRCLTTD
jgi:hypothetical protein